MSRRESRAKRDEHKIMFRLKAETGSYHSRLESLPYFSVLIEHRLPLECYVNQLRALSVVHGVLENEIARVDEPPVSHIWHDGMRKLALLEEDLSFFEPRVIPDADAPLQAALSMTEKMRLLRVENPAALLGFLYVFEGSTLGNHMHRPDIAATFHLNKLEGCRYYASYQDQIHANWARFSDQMNSEIDDPTVQNTAVEAATEAFSGLETLYSALHPLKVTPGSYHVTRINPEAGHHPIPKDRREIQAALRASDRVWKSFGYYSQRYAERGKRFAASDTCWLVTLTGLDQEILQQQIDWLCRVLATRGMPTLMMEQTLRCLHQELSEAIPERKKIYKKLVNSADHLKKTRHDRIQEASLESLAEAFEQSVENQLAAAYHNTGRLLVSAVVDQKNGIEGAIDAIQGWLTDGNRFPKRWVAAVNNTIQKAIERSS